MKASNDQSDVTVTLHSLTVQAMERYFPALSELCINVAEDCRTEPGDGPTSLTEYLEKEFEPIAEEAINLGDRLTARVGLDEWRKSILENPPSPEVIAYFVARCVAMATLQPLKQQDMQRYLGGKKRYAAMNEAKLFVQKKWASEGSGYGYNKSEFARVYVRIVSNNFKNSKNEPLKVTEKTIRESWLREPPSASKPAG